MQISKSELTMKERYFSFDSHHPAALKRAMVKSLTDRAKVILSPVDQQSKEMKHVIAACNMLLFMQVN